MRASSKYATKRKSNGGADRYGTYQSGWLVTPETIAGHSISKQLPTMLVKKEVR